MGKQLVILLFLFGFLMPSYSQSTTLTLTPEQAEQLFLTQNLELIAEKMNISVADAAIVQAKVWENPTLTVSDLNLWSTDTQRGGEAEVIPPLFGGFARNTQFSIELSQLIQTANKRGKLVRIEKISKEMTVSNFEEVLRGLKIELRQALYELEYVQHYLEVVNNEIVSLTNLTESYSRQVKAGNLPKSELLRLQSALFETENERLETETERNRLRKELNILLNLPPHTELFISTTRQDWVNPETLSLSTLFEIASENRPDLKLSVLQTQKLEKTLAFEKAQRVPDLTLSASYDRYGGVWKDFIGFGVSIDLPVFNRNQGTIKAARIEIEQSRYGEEMQHNTARNEIVEAWKNYSLIYDFYRRIEENPLLTELDDMLDSYTRNLLDRNISLIEYVDFLEAYKSNKQTWLNSVKNLAARFEELQYTVGTDIK
ncbi:MAG: TolC family protein [Tannerellaceae bacterium]|nr:TolC family protein [Tannerellaceae bacterium]